MCNFYLNVDDFIKSILTINEEDFKNFMEELVYKNFKDTNPINFYSQCENGVRLDKLFVIKNDISGSENIDMSFFYFFIFFISKY